MKIAIWIIIFLGTFGIMEFMAWFTHKYIMHGFLWSLHKDHHRKDHDSWFERNDAFFIFYAVVSMSFIMIAVNTSFWYGWPIGIGIMAYGATYFLVHDIFIHQRFKLFRNANNWYARGIRRAHKIHHKHLGKDKGECFGMLFVPFKYFKK
ncbi:sterol desaturase family protein [Sungkyunkwania multivorans]|uniref:Sterol desaturase family protein n=1 Tax=Sungkyunkwania multivorans TaxID=1173618 RepID=A0ABW3CTY3_9FLAO